MGSQLGNTNDDMYSSLLGEFERRRSDTEDNELPGHTEAPNRRPPNLGLPDIRALLDNGQARSALPFIDDYLLRNPNDQDALLLKAEICLELGIQSAFVGKVFAELRDAYGATPAYQRLSIAIEQAIREKLETGRAELGYRLNEALKYFGVVADYATTDPAATMAVVLALLKHLDLNKQAVPASAKLRSALDRFILLTLERSAPGMMVHEEAIRYRVYLMLHEGQIDQALTWLQSKAHYARYRDHLQAATSERAIQQSLQVMVGLVRNGQLELMLEIIRLGLIAAPDSPTLRYFAGEIALIQDQSVEALAFFEDAEQRGHLGYRISDGETRQKAWAYLSKTVITCTKCGKSVAPTQRVCSYCDESIVKHELVLDVYHLGNSFDVESVGLIAGIAQAHTLDLLDQPQAALDKIAHLLSKLPDNTSIHQELIQLQAKIMAAHPDLFPNQPPTTVVAIVVDPVDEACREIDTILALPNLDTDSLLALRISFLPESVSANQRRDAAHLDLCSEHVTPQALPLKTRQAIIKRLVKERHLEFARDLMPVLFVDNPARKSVQHLGEMVEKAITTTVEHWLDDADELLERGMAEQVMTLCEEALALYPNHPVALLMRGRARRQLGAELAALDDFYHVLRLHGFHANPTSRQDNQPCPFLRHARILTAETLEQRWETQQALAMLDGLDDVDYLRRRIERRQADVPAVRLLPVTEAVMTDTLERVYAAPYTHAFFAVAVRSVGRMTLAAPAWVEQVLMAGYEFVQILGGLRNSVGEPVFALRLISAPHPHLSERGQLRLALVARISGDSDAAAEQMARQLWMTLKEILPLRREYAFVFEPIIDEAELDSLLRPFEIGSVAEIVRREDMPTAANERYAVYPYTPPLGLDLHNLCWALLRQPAPAMVSIHLLPTTLMAWERATLNAQMASTKPPEPPYDRENVQYDRVATWWQETPRWGQAQANRYLVDSLSLHAYILQVNVVGSRQMNALLPEQVAAALFGTPRTSGEARYGGYEIIRASHQDEFAVACRNLQTLDVERWVYSTAPESAPRLRYLVTENEAAIALRLPIPGPDGLPGMPLIDAKPIPPPSGMPSNGTLIGESVARTAGAPTRIIQSTDDRRRHVYIVGKTGTGKSTLIKGMALQDIEAGHGVCVVDPHGDLIDDILLRIPPHRAKDVIVFDPADETRPIGLNLLVHRHESERHQVVNEFIGLLMRMYDPGGSNMIVGPRFQHNVRMAMLTAMSVPGSTLIEVVRALTDQAYVKAVMPHVTDPMVRMYWEKQIAQTSDFHKSEVLDYIVSKFSRFTGDKRVRNIIGQSESTVDFRRVMDHRQVLLVNLSKGKIGPENAQFLGLLMVQQLLLTALSRADLPANERPDFYLYVDEFQNFATEMFGTMLSEGRKYGVALTIANQYLTQLPHPIREAIFGNVGSIISFRLGTQDATALAPELYPVFSVDDLLNLPRYTGTVKLLVDGLAARPFTMRTVPDLHAPNPTRAAEIRERSRTVYGRDEEEVTEEVLSRLKARG